MYKTLGMLFMNLFIMSSTEVMANNNYIESLDISVGVNHVCAQTVAGIKCFGNSEAITLNSPANPKNPRLMSAGNRFSCMIVDEGIRCWGEIPGQKKNNILIGQDKIKMPKLLAVGYEHACGVSEANAIYCWGKNDFGESTPPVNLKNVTEISLGMSNSCALADGKVVCWGMSSAGSVSVPENIMNPRNLTSGWWHHCVQSDEGIKCWGYPFKEYAAPDDQSIINFVSGGFFNCAITSEGVKCWDELGKTNLVENSAGATKLSVGSTFACAITPEKGVICWKLAGNSKLTLLKSFVPSGGVTNIQFVSAGNASTCVYGDENVLKCWGYNPDGALDVPDTLTGLLTNFTLGSHKLCSLSNSVLSCYGDNRKVYDIPKNLGNVTMVSAGGYHICAGTNDKISCWGDDVRDAVSVPNHLSNISQISSGFTHACAVANDEVNCWGGTGLIKNVNPAKKMMSPRAICAGGTFSCGIDSLGKVSCWGTKIPFNKEVEASNEVLNVPEEINDAVEISCGLSHACAIYNGKVKCWGSAGKGKNISPEVTIKNPHMLTAGWNHTCALGDQGLSCWGDMLNMNMPNYSLEK